MLGRARGPPRGPARLGSAGPRRAVGSPTRPGCDGSAGRGLRAVAPEDAGQDVLGGRGVHAVDAGSLSGSAAASARWMWFSDRPRVRAQQLSGLGAGQDHVRRLDRKALRRADGGRVPEPDVIRDVGRGQHDAATQPSRGWGDSEAAVPADVSDAPTILVLDPVGVADTRRRSLYRVKMTSPALTWVVSDSMASPARRPVAARQSARARVVSSTAPT